MKSSSLKATCWGTAGKLIGVQPMWVARVRLGMKVVL